MSKTGSGSTSTNNTDLYKYSPNMYVRDGNSKQNSKFAEEGNGSSVSDFYNKSSSIGSFNKDFGFKGSVRVNWEGHWNQLLGSVCTCSLPYMSRSEARQMESKCLNYWWWELPLIIIKSYTKAKTSFKPVEEFRAPAPTPQPKMSEIESYHSGEESNRLSKGDLNLELLKDFEYDTEIRGGDLDDKPLTVFICRYHNCNKEFTRTWNILDHARMHMGVKPFQCDSCNKSFTQKGNLKKHMKTHILPDVESRKRYKCEFCGSSYTERYNYKVNFLWNNIKTEFIPYMK